MSSTLTISAAHLRHNVHAARHILGSTTLLAVIKANAYGHSATLCAPILVQAGVQWLGVTDAQEGAAVRAVTGPGPGILIMTAPPGDPAEAADAARLTVLHHLTPIVFTPDQLIPLAQAASAPLPIHVEIDTGMSRQGVLPGPAFEAFLNALATHPSLRLDGLCTHLASAESTDAAQTTSQMNLLHAAAFSAPQTPWLHVGNTSTLDNASPSAALTIPRLEQFARENKATLMIRCGLGLYGFSLPLTPDTPAEARLRPNLKPVLTWTTTITAVQDIPAGAKIGYSATYTAPRPMRIALLPVGYADGLRRALSSTDTEPGGWVIVNGMRANIVGRISMNLTTIDVTGVDAEPGTPVTLLGEGITAEDHAHLAQCLPYEILCGLRATNRRVLPDGPPTRGAVTS